MPVMEAMTVGLPIVIPPSKENFSEGLEGNVVFTKADSDSFATSINELLNNKVTYKTFSDKAKIKALDFSGKNLEKREAVIYTELIGAKTKWWLFPNVQIVLNLSKRIVYVIKRNIRKN